MTDRNSYFHFAEDDFVFFTNAYNAGLSGNAMGALAQNCCEKYIKHLVDKYYSPTSDFEHSQKEGVLHTHSLFRLINFVQNNMSIEYTSEAKSFMRQIDGFYFSTRYPSSESIDITSEELELAKNAVDFCRRDTIELEQSIIRVQNNQQEQTENNLNDDTACENIIDNNEIDNFDESPAL